MTTTSVAPATTERPAVGKPGAAKPAAQPGAVPGQFAALLLQADEEALAPEASDTGATGLTASDTNDKDTEASSTTTTSADAAQLALQALLDWRSLGQAKGKEPTGPNAPEPPKTAALSAGAQQTKPTADAPLPGPLALQTNSPPPGKTSETVLTQLPGAPSGTPGDAEKLATSKLAPDAAPNLATAGPTPPTPALPTPTADVGAAVQAMGKGKPNTVSKALASSNARPTGAATGEAALTGTAAGNPKPPEPTEHIRSTVELANRGSEPDNSSEARALERSETLEPLAVSARTGNGSPTGDGTQQALTADTGGTLAPTGPDAAAAPESFSNMFQSQMDEVGSQISYWSAQGAQRASFTVGSAQDMPVEVTLSFADGALDVTFETEEEGVRELLENQAHEALQHLMDAQGIVLGGVSVGGGRSQAQRDSGNESTTVDMIERGRNRKPAAGSDATPPAARRTPEIMTATKLDLYA